MVSAELKLGQCFCTVHDLVKCVADCLTLLCTENLTFFFLCFLHIFSQRCKSTDSSAVPNTAAATNASQRKCRMGAGEEETPGKGDTPGFDPHDDPCVVKDDRGFMNFEPARNSKRMVTTSLHCLVSWRGNCKVDIILCESDPKNPDPADVANVTDYVVSYSCKGHTTLVEEKKQIRDLIRR